MTKQEVNTLLQVVRESLARASWLTTSEHHLRMLHLAVILDVAHHITTATAFRFAQWMYSTATRRYLSVFDQLSSELESALRTQAVTVIRNFPSVMGIPRVVKILLKEAIGDSSEPELLVGMLRQMLVFPLRYNFEGAADVIDGLLEVNATRNHTPSEILVEIMHSLIDEQFVQDFATGFQPRHGNGSVSYLRNGRTVSRRMPTHRKDALLDEAFVRNTLALVPGFEWNDSLLTSYTPEAPKSPSKVISVPKTWKKKRIVAVEDVSRMWCQQGVRAALVYAIERSPVLHRHIDFQRPEKNRELARYGSLTRRFATIDLSSASDSVGYKFVASLLKDTPLWPVLDRLHTQQFLTEEHGVTSSNIFATMGNAICFPVMTLVLTAIVLEAARQCQIPEQHLDFVVYGDDIIVPEVILTNVLRLLDQYGFAVNKDKTFTGDSVFRESCGGEYVNGLDVTPVRISRKFKVLSLDAGIDNLFAIVDLANACRWTLPTVRRLCLEALSIGYQLHIPASLEGETGVASVDPKQFMQAYPTGWYDEYQYPYWVVDWPRIRLRRFRRDTPIALIEWLATAETDHSRTTSTDGLEQPICTSTATGSGRVSVRKWRYLLAPGILVHVKSRRSE